MITSMPRPSAWLTYSAVSTGVRCADSTRHSCATPKRVSISSAWRMVSQSDLLPMMTATSAPLSATVLLPLCQGVPGLPVECVESLGGGDGDAGGSHAPQQSHELPHIGMARRYEAAAIAIGAESPRVAVRPDFHAAIVDHLQRHPFARQFAEIGRAAWRER